MYMNRLRTIIRLYEGRRGLKSISSLSWTSRNTKKKYIQIWNSLNMSYEEFQRKSDSELNRLFCVKERSEEINPRMAELESLLADICRELGRKGMRTLKQWEKYLSEPPSGYGLAPFRIAVQRYRIVSNPSLRIEGRSQAVCRLLRGQAAALPAGRIAPSGRSPCSGTGL